MKKGEDHQTRPADDQHSDDKRTRFWALNNPFLNKSSGKDPNPNKQQKYVEAYIHVSLKPERKKGNTKKMKEPEDQSAKSYCNLLWKKEYQKEAEERFAFLGHVIR